VVKLSALVLLSILSLSLALSLVKSNISSSTDVPNEQLNQEKPLIGNYLEEGKWPQTFETLTSNPRLDNSSFYTQGMGDDLSLDFVPGKIIVKYRNVATKPDYLQGLNQKFGLNSAEKVFATKITELSKIYKLKFDEDANVLFLAEQFFGPEC
jgi:hypothetical protein